MIARLVRKDFDTEQVAFQRGQMAFQRGLETNRVAPSSYLKSLLPPEIAPTTASSLDNSSPENRQKKQKYDSDILPPRLYANAIVYVKSYVRFVRGCSKAANEEGQPSADAAK